MENSEFLGNMVRCIMSRAKLATSQNPKNPSRATNLAPKQSYSQVVQTRKPTRDPEKQARDCGKVSPDLSRDLSRGHTRSHDPTCSARATHPLINTWQTVGTNQRINKGVGIPPMKGNPQRNTPLALKRIEPVCSSYWNSAIQLTNVPLYHIRIYATRSLYFTCPQGLRTDHPALVYKTCEFSGIVFRLFSCLPPRVTRYCKVESL